MFSGRWWFAARRILPSGVVECSREFAEGFTAFAAIILPQAFATFTFTCCCSFDTVQTPARNGICLAKLNEIAMAATKEKEKAASKRKSEEKAKKAPNSEAQKASSLSQEFVVDSDEEDAAPEDRGVKKVVTPKRSKETAATAKKPAPAKAPSSSEEDDEDEEDDDDDDESMPDAPAPAKPTENQPPKVNGVKRTAEQQSEDDESEEDSEEEESDEPKAKRAKSGDEAESSEEEDDEEEEGNESSAEEAPVPAPAPVSRPRTQQAPPEPPKSIPAPPYDPPAGYAPLDFSNEAADDQFSEHSLASKQIWHITAPSNVPLSSVKEVALDSMKSAKVVLSHNGTDYVLNEATIGDDAPSVFVPGKDGYTPMKRRVDKTLHLQQKIVLPNLSKRQASQAEGSAAAADVAKAAVSTVRPQPKGLRMRYKPIGFGAGQPGMHLSAEEANGRAEQAGFQFPKTLGPSEPRMPTEVEKTVGGEAPAKKKKKKKDKANEVSADNHESSKQSVAGTELSRQKGTSETVALQPAKKVVMPETVDQDVEMVDADQAEKAGKGEKDEKIRKEEKARLKEEKRKRKEAKAKAKEAAVL
jgi:hypothetical protein